MTRTDAHAEIDFDGTLRLTYRGTTTTSTHPTPGAAREHALDAVADLARDRRGPVRLNTSGAQGDVRVSVFPDGSVTALPPEPVAAAQTSADPAPTNPQPASAPVAPHGDPAGDTQAGTAGVDTAPALAWAHTATPVADAFAAANATGPHVAVDAAAELEDEVAVTVLVQADEEEIPERTVLHRPPMPDAPTARLYTSRGTVLEVAGIGILGRKPTGPGQLVAFPDPERSVSRTHLTFTVTDAGMTITDAGSGNGTRITTNGSTEDCVPGTPYDVTAGARVDVGFEFFIIA